MQLKFQLFLLLCITAIAGNAQDNATISLHIGDAAPPLRVAEWIKGSPVRDFEKGKVYVLEFWATWCKPCLAVMPHLSSIARNQQDRVIAIAIDIYEWKVKPVMSVPKIRAFVDSMGRRMDFNVTTEDTNFTVNDWLGATGEKDKGIPRSFIIDAEGRLAWMGHPSELDKVLPKIVNNTWDIKEALAERNEKIRLENLDNSLADTLRTFTRFPGKPDSLLSFINDQIDKEPKLKYADFLSFYTFSALLQTNADKAYSYGKAFLTASDEPNYNTIVNIIQIFSDSLNFPANIYELGAEAEQAKIDKYAQYGNLNVPKDYSIVADMYWHAKNKLKAIEAMQTAIIEGKKDKFISKELMDEFQLKLQQYKQM